MKGRTQDVLADIDLIVPVALGNLALEPFVFSSGITRQSMTQCGINGWINYTYLLTSRPFYNTVFKIFF